MQNQDALLPRHHCMQPLKAYQPTEHRVSSRRCFPYPHSHLLRYQLKQAAPLPFDSAATSSDMTDFLSSLAAAGFFSGETFGGAPGEALGGPSSEMRGGVSDKPLEGESDILDTDDDSGLFGFGF